MPTARRRRRDRRRFNAIRRIRKHISSQIFRSLGYFGETVERDDRQLLRIAFNAVYGKSAQEHACLVFRGRTRCACGNDDKPSASERRSAA